MDARALKIFDVLCGMWAATGVWSSIRSGRSRSAQGAELFAQVGAVSQNMEQGAFRSKLDHRDGADGTGQAITKAADINAQEAANGNADGGFMGNDEHVAGAVALFDFLDNLQGAA